MASHYVSAAAVSFARGLNDTPKIVALLLVVAGPRFARLSMLAIALAMALGGLLNARKVAETMSKKISKMNDGQALTANLVTAFMVIVASRLGMPVSTTHVSVGAISGIGIVNGSADRERDRLDPAVVGAHPADRGSDRCDRLCSAARHSLMPAGLDDGQATDRKNAPGSPRRRENAATRAACAIARPPDQHRQILSWPATLGIVAAGDSALPPHRQAAWSLNLVNIQIVKDYYGKTLQTSADLKTEACCTPDDMPGYVKRLLANVHDEVLAKYYGCGLVTPMALEGARILDLGCGSGRDVYALAQLVGPKGEVVGVDMTAEQLAVARAHVEWHRKKFGFKKSNVRFLDGYIEKLGDLGLKPGSFDIIISNCVINLSTDKLAVLKGAYDLLKPGGEMYFSDVYADRRLPDAVRNDPVLYGECLGGALYWNDFHTLAKQAGFLDPRLVDDRPLGVTDEKLAAKLGAGEILLRHLPPVQAR